MGGGGFMQGRKRLEGRGCESARSRGAARRRRLALIAGLALVLLLAMAAAASAKDRIYWANANEGNGETIAYANLDGSGGADFNLGGAVADGPSGLAMDLSANRLYWTNSNSPTISYANLDGSGNGGQLATGAAEFDEPLGLAIDPATDTAYWANFQGSISYAKLDGSGGGTLNTTGATLDEPGGVAVDQASGRLYWANEGSISYANLDGSGGGGTLDTGALGNSITPFPIAIDPVARRVYWVGITADLVASSALDGSGSEALDATGATVESPEGVAIDPAAGRVYWTNEFGENDDDGVISYADLGGGNAHDLPVPGATLDGPASPVLLKAPQPVGPPALTGSPTTGSTLTCGSGDWAADQVEASLYREPQSFSYRWERDGSAIPGASASTLVADRPGAYRCTVTATNPAGSASQESNAVKVPAPPAPPHPGPPAPSHPRPPAPPHPRPPAGRARLKLRVVPHSKTVRPGGKAVFRATVRNAGQARSRAVRLCLRVPKKARKALRAPRCKRIGALAPGARAKRRFKVKAKRRAHGAYRLRFELRGADGRAKATLRVKRRG